MAAPKRFAFVLSTAGSVMNRVLHAPWVRSVTQLAVADRACPGIEAAAQHGIPTRLIDEPDPEAFCEQLDAVLQRTQIDYVVSFYTNFYSAAFRDRYRDRIINFHPSLLPAFKGMDGFGEGHRYHAKILGSTVELIKDVMDEGKIVMQTAFPADPKLSLDALRHCLFEQQCRSLIQTMKWLDEGRLTISGDQVSITDARFDGVYYAPALEFQEAIDLNIPRPDGL